MRALTTAVLAAGVVAAAGCGGGPKYAPVSGRVTLNNQPIAGVQVDFQPIAVGKSDPGPGSSAKTDADGRFTLKSQIDPSQAGAVVGPHQVRVWPAEGVIGKDADAGKANKKGAIPGRYHVESTLKFDVQPGGTTEANFALTSP